MSSLQHILASEPDDAPPSRPATAVAPSSQPIQTDTEPSTTAASPPPPRLVMSARASTEGTPSKDAAHAEDAPGASAVSGGANGSAAANAAATSAYPGNKIKHLKKEDGIPLWRKDIQYDFLRYVFEDKTKCFTKYTEKTTNHTFAEVYIDAMAKSSKCSKILKEKLLQDTEGAISMAMVCLLVNVGRMNTTLNFFPEMRAQLRTYHSIPALQARQDPSAYKQLQDAPRLKSILKGATEDEPQPSTLEDIVAHSKPRTNAVNLIFVMSQYTLKMTETHFDPPTDFFDIIMKSTLSSKSRAKAFLWLIWWYLESNLTKEDALNNPFGPGEYGESEGSSTALPVKPHLHVLTDEEAELENVDTEEEKAFGEVKRKERISILASEPSPAMTALKRARKEKAMLPDHMVPGSDDDGSQLGWYRDGGSIRRGVHETASDYTRSPSPAGLSGKPKPGEIRINNLLNEDGGSEGPAPAPVKKGPGRGNWRRNRPKVEPAASGLRASESSHHVPLLPNNGQLSFVNDGPRPSLLPGNPYQLSPPHSTSLSFQPPSTRDHIPMPSFQSSKRHRGVTQHQSAVISHRKQQIDYTLDRRIRKVHIRASDKREAEGLLFRAWKRLHTLPANYDSEDETTHKPRKGKENDTANEEAESLPSNRSAGAAILAGLVRIPSEPSDVGEEARYLAQMLRRASRRLVRWEDSNFPGHPMIKRRETGETHAKAERRRRERRRALLSDDRMDEDENGGLPPPPPPPPVRRRRAPGTGPPRRSRGARKSEPKAGSAAIATDADPADEVEHEEDEEEEDIVAKEESDDEDEDDDDGEPVTELMEMDDEDGAGDDLDDDEREMLGEVDADESDDGDEDEDMGDD